MHFGGNSDVKSAPIWQIAKRSNDKLPVNELTGKQYTPVKRRDAPHNDRYFSGC